MRILCLGAGAIGGYFGGRLVEAGADISFLVREKRRKQLAEDGICIESQFGNSQVAVKTIDPSEASGDFDIIILTCKAYDLPSAIHAIVPFVGSSTGILPLINGVAHIELLNATFGTERVMGGITKIAVTMTGDGLIKHLNDWRYITFGEQSGLMSSRVLALKAAFDNTSVVATAVPHIMQSMWEKIVHLSTVAGMTCAMRASVGDIASTRLGSDLMIDFLEQNAEIARREGFAPSEEFLDEYRQLFRNKDSTYTASMLRDIQKNGPIEADHILGFMLDKAICHKINPDMHRIICAHLQSYERSRAVEAASNAAL
jgi:2-dehydropantoate 2-reductase